MDEIMVACAAPSAIRRASITAIAAIVAFATFILYSSHASATQASPPGQAPAFRSNARVVLVDVLVTDRDGKPVVGLRRDDFTLTDDGAKQKLSAVEEHQRETTNDARVPFALGPEVRTNWVSSPTNGAVNIIVFDTLNTLAPDRAYARQELLKLLQNLPRGQRLALFTLGTRLHMVQGFTTNSEVLIAAAKNIRAGSGLPSATDPVDAQFGQQASIGQQGNAGQQRSATQQGSEEIQAAANDVGATLDAIGIYRTMMDTRVAYTLDALRDLAKATASLPGRKNVIWLTTGFPLTINGAMRSQRSYSDQIRTAVAALASSQIAIYPVDVRGLIAPTPELMKKLVGAGENAPGSNMKTTMVGGIDERDTMTTIAEETGGRAYYNRNDLDVAIANVIDTGSYYYTLAYSPRDIKWDGRYHSIDVKVAKKDVQVTYRRGYVALGDSPMTELQAAVALGDAVSVELMDSRMILLAAEVSQPEAPSQPLRINYHIDPSTLVLDESADRAKSASLAIGATAWQGKTHKGDVASRLQPVLKAEGFRRARTTGISGTLEMMLGPGAYTLKMAVIDLNSGKIGSLSMPLKVEVQPQKASAAGASHGATSSAKDSTITAPDSGNPEGSAKGAEPGAKAITITEYCQALAKGSKQPEALKTVCEFALSVQQRLPNYICEETIHRYQAYGYSSPTDSSIVQRLNDVIETEVTVEDGRESYSRVTVNGKPSDTSMLRMRGMGTTGQFGNQLQSLFAPENKARFKFKKEVTLKSRPALLFYFEIRSGNNQSFKVWKIEGRTDRPGYKGSLWVDKSSLRPIRLDMISTELQSQTSLEVSITTDYGEIPLADGSTFLLPLKSRVVALPFRNDIEFKNCHKFGVKTQILTVE